MGCRIDGLSGYEALEFGCELRCGCIFNDLAGKRILGC
jgi:hypothetical protein